MYVRPVITVLTKSKFLPRNRQNTFSLLMQANFENSYRDRLVPKILGFLSFWGNPGPVSGRKLTFCEHCIRVSGKRPFIGDIPGPFIASHVIKMLSSYGEHPN